VAQRDAKKAYQSRMQQQERLAIRYLKIGQSSQCPYYKGIKIIFQNYEKIFYSADAQFAGSSSVPAHLEMIGFLGIGNNPIVGCTVACAVDVAQALSR